MTTYSKETALYDTGAISDGINEASETATGYITDVTDGGIFVHTTDSEDPSNPTGDDTNNGVSISDGIYIVRNGVVVASYGENVNIGTSNSGQVRITNDGVTIISPTKATAMEVSTSGVVSVVTMNEDLGWDSTRQNDITYYDEYDYGLKISPSQLGTSEEITASYIFDVLDDANSNSSFDISVFCSLSKNRATGGGYGTPTYRYGVSKSFRKGTASVQTVREEDSTWDQIQIAYDGIKTITIKELSTKSNYSTSDNASSYGGDYTAIRSITYKTNSYSPLIAFTGQIEETGDITVTGHVDAVDGFKTNGKYIGSYIKVTGTSTGTSTLNTSPQKIYMDTQIGKKGNAFAFDSQLTGGGIHIFVDGIVLVGGKIRVGQNYSGSDIVIFEVWVNSTAVYTHRYRVPPNMTTPAQHIALPTIPLTVSSGDKIYLYAYNATAGRGTVLNSETELYATFIAPSLS